MRSVSDFGSSEQYSSSVMIERAEKSPAKVYSRITKDRFFVYLGGEIERNTQLKLTDLDGKIVLSTAINHLTSEHNIQYLRAGIYFLTLTHRTKVETWKMTKS